ncbi:hypothetical protein [Lysobacter sp. TY2-98]|uniref:hypothetical protein n=1 Tax=Lysobacter sp. TY2-98 TaxID=2290922 RepID=UPI0013B43C36|nr:hypothetical protein [Lysobacter sp. TY2-98]
MNNTPLRVEVVDDAALGTMTGKYYGADMLVGVRIDLVSQLATAQGGTATAVGSLYVQKTGNGYDVQVDSHASASAGNGSAPVSNNIATGGEQIHVDGIGQITQIAGDGNRMGNLTIVQLGSNPAAPSGFNGASSAQAQDGALQAQVSFVGGGVQLGLVAPGATIGQQVTPGASGRITQIGQIAGDGFTASNALHLQMMTSALPASAVQQLGIQQALSAVSGLRH